jgi:Protein of unknown function (DUF3105)
MRSWAGSVGAGLLLALAMTGCSDGDTTTSTASVPNALSTPATEGIEGVTAYAPFDPKTDQSHVGGKVSYPVLPPVRGAHNAIWQNCGFYTKPVADENAVHSLEHGAVWITYSDTVDAATTSTLAAMAKANRYLLISPYAANPAPIVLSVWGRQLRVDRIDDPRVSRFIDSYGQDGPTVPEVGAACSGALGIAPDRPGVLNK